MSVELKMQKWNLVDESTHYSNSHSSKSLRLQSKQFRQSSKLGDSTLFSVDYGDRPMSRGLFADLESPFGRLMEETA